MLKIFILLLILFFITFLLLKKLSHIRLIKGIPSYYLGILCLLIISFFLFTLRIINNISSEGKYIPAEYNGEKLIPGKIEFEKE